MALFLTLSACQPRAAVPPVPAASPTRPGPSATPTVTEIPSMTPVFVVSPAAPDTPIPTQADLLPTSSATPETLQLFFPTEEATDNTEHRPPLYPIPWAISPHDHFFFSRPISADYPAEPLWDFRYGGVYFGPNSVHTGIDIPAPTGTPVLAAGPGTVVWAGEGLFSGSPGDQGDPYGNAVAIRHDFGYDGQPLFTIYAHMSEIDVILGQTVKTGEQIGRVGATGNATGPHLHFEVRLGKNDFFYTRNPELWLAPAQGWGVLVGRAYSWFNTPLTKYEVYVRNVQTDKKYAVFTYGPSTVNGDDYYQENLVLSDLPAGVYEINCQYEGLDNKVKLQILPGQVTYFSFKGDHGYTFTPPAPAPTATATRSP